MDAPDLLRLPEGLPVPVDDGAASHLPGRAMPALSLPATDGRQVALDALGSGRTVVYIYPMTGRPGVDLPEGWDDIPGARGCTPESCAFRNLYADLQAAGAAQVFGLSSQPTDYQAEAVDRLHLPFAMLSDEHLALVGALGLPTFSVDGMTLYRRLTMIVTDGAIEHVFYPVFPPDQHAQEVLDWLRAHLTELAAEQRDLPPVGVGGYASGTRQEARLAVEDLDEHPGPGRGELQIVGSGRLPGVGGETRVHRCLVGEVQLGDTVERLCATIERIH